jgi:hypothetical protein
METYIETTKDVYQEAALTSDVGLCLNTTPIWSFPGLDILSKMKEMQFVIKQLMHYLN